MFAFAVLNSLGNGGSRGEAPPKIFGVYPPPPPPLSQGLDPALLGDRSNWPGVILLFNSR